ncbi:hypothetical protein TNCV_2729601 [Trichonephila clavipes]|nr:hypothetical protein TNCV_2729601 [Trichonephila clavipes]
MSSPEVVGKGREVTDAPDNLYRVFPRNWDGTESNRTVNSMVPKPTDRPHRIDDLQHLYTHEVADIRRKEPTTLGFVAE